MRPASCLIALLTIFILCAHCFGQSGQNRQKRQVTVITDEDKKYKGQFVKADESGVIIENNDGQTTIKLDRVKLIMFGDIPESSLPSLSGRTNKSIHQRVEIQGMTLEFIEARMLRGSVICELMITSNDLDREVSIYSGDPNANQSRLFDENGGEYIIGSAQLGNKTGYPAFLRLIAGVPVKATLRFINVPQEASKITLLNFLFFAGPYSGNLVSVQFRNIPITK